MSRVGTGVVTGELTATVRDADTRLDRAIVAANSDLAGLAVLLDDDALADLLGAPGVRADRLRLKPASSARVAVVDAEGRWSIVHAYTPATWAKAAKDIRVARQHGRPFVVDGDLRIVAARASFDRRLQAIQVWRPDSPRGPRRRAFDALRSLGVGRGGIDRRAISVRTMAHNPSRRWVGAVSLAGEPVAVVKVFARRASAARAPELAGALAASGVVVAEHVAAPGLPGTYATSWVGGRHADAAADADVVGTAVTRLSAGDPGDLPASEPAGNPAAMAASLTSAARALGSLDAEWGRRAEVVAQRLDRRPRVASEVAVHGDLSPDQLLIDGAGVTVIDLDRAGRGPAGWDAASWIAAQVAADPGARPVALPGPAPDDWTVAATSLLRAPEPFRRRRSGRAAATEALLCAAEDAAGRC